MALFGRSILLIESMSSMVSMWANLLAIIAVLALTGIFEISVKPNVKILKPVYIVEKEDIRKSLNSDRYPLADSLIAVIFNSYSTVIADMPAKLAIDYSTGQAIDYCIRPMPGDSSYCSSKILTNGTKIFRNEPFAYSPREELLGELSYYMDSNKMKLYSYELRPNLKRILVMPFFTNLMANRYGRNWRSISTDSLLKIEEEFERIKIDTPPLLSSALFDMRRVYSILSIENHEAFDVEGLQLHITKRYPYSLDDRLNLEAWTIGRPILYCKEKCGNNLSIQIPNLDAHSDLQIVISSWCTDIKNEDITFTYEKLKSVNAGRVERIVIITGIFSLLCGIAIVFRGRSHHLNKTLL